MTGSLPTFSFIRQRYNYLIGNSDYTTTNVINDSHINTAVQDALNLYPFSWNLTTTTGSLTAGTFSLPADYNPKWHLFDVRIVNSDINDDNLFYEINIQDRDRYGTGNYVYWITYNTSTKLYVFNSPVQTGTITYYYYFLPSTMSATTDALAQAVTCIIPDGECIAYLAASKNWIGDERNQALSADYMKEGMRRLALLYTHDLQFGPGMSQGSMVDYNSQLTRGRSQGNRIAI